MGGSSAWTTLSSTLQCRHWSNWYILKSVSNVHIIILHLFLLQEHSLRWTSAYRVSRTSERWTSGAPSRRSALNVVTPFKCQTNMCSVTQPSSNTHCRVAFCNRLISPVLTITKMTLSNLYASKCSYPPISSLLVFIIVSLQGPPMIRSTNDVNHPINRMSSTIDKTYI